jgi:hypothetical protein
MLSKKAMQEIMGAIGGVVVGAVMGSIANPWSALVGGGIGALIGLGIGGALDDEEARISLHDRELDRVIGVGGETMGTGLSEPPTPSSPHPVTEHEWFRPA